MELVPVDSVSHSIDGDALFDLLADSTEPSEQP